MIKLMKDKMQKIMTQSEKNILKYFLSILLKNWSLRIIVILSFLIIVIVPPVLLDRSKFDISLFENSFIILIIPLIMSLIVIAVATIIIFLKTKTNNVDLFLSISIVKDRRIFYLKQLAIFIILLHTIIGIFISSIIMTSLGGNLGLFLLLFIIQTFSMILMNLIWLIIFSWITYCTNYWTGSFIISLLSIIVPVGILTPVMISSEQSSSWEFNSNKYKENLVKIYSINHDGVIVKKSLAIYENPAASKNRKVESISPSSWEIYSPFNVALGLSPIFTNLVMNNNISVNKMPSINTRFSIGEIKFKESFFGDLKNYENTIISGINDKTIFDFENKNKLFEAIDQKLIENDIIRNKISDDNYWTLSKNELEKRNIWDLNISNEMKSVILHISGLDASSSILYNIFNGNKYIYNRYLDGIKKYLSNKYSKGFTDFINYIWNNQQVKLNIFSYETLGSKVYEEYHPNLNSYDALKPANYYDIMFIKNYLFHSNNVKGFKLQMLNKHSIYEDLNNIQNIFGEAINSRKQLEEYIDGHNTINELKEIIKKATAKIYGNGYQVHFRNNISNSFKLNRQIEFETANKYWINLAYLSILVFLVMFVQKHTIKKIEKGDMKLWN